MSATGSVRFILGVRPLPAGLAHAGDLAAKGQLPEANAAQLELAQRAAAATAALTAVVAAHLELRRPLRLLDPRLLRHSLSSGRRAGGRRLAPERHAHFLEQRHRGVVAAGAGHEGDVHPVDALDFVVVDLGEDHLLLEADGVVAPAVEALGRQPAEVAHPRHSHADEAVQKLVHARAAQRHAAADRGALPQVEVRDRLLVLLLGLFLGLRHRHFTRGIGWPDLTAIRSIVPSWSRRRRTRVGSPDLGSRSITLAAAIGAVISTIPLSSPACAARLCFFTTFTPSTTTRNFLGKTCRIFPSLPRSSPLMTRTRSPLATCSLYRAGSVPRTRRLFL